jgi:sugar/nucleoside kinase (ribokinase family)
VLVRPGGTSSNAAVWAAWSGARAGVVAAVGTDIVGDLLAARLSARGVDAAGLVRRDGSSGIMLVVVEEGERSMVADRGASAALRTEDVAALRARAVLVSGYLLLQEPGHDVALAALEGAEAPLVAVEAASWPLVQSFGAERFLDETAHASAILANDREAEVLSRGLVADDAARWLGERYRVAAVKRGRDGAVLVVDGEVVAAPAEALDEVDPTGAGDAFDGVLLARLARGAAPAEALAAACHAGGLVAASAENWPAEGAA